AEPTDTVVVREFLASNQSGIQDEDGERQDWIEIYNGTGAAVDLAGWSLTDQADRADQWNFPSRVLPHGARLVVFASGKDSAKRPGYGPASELHTNFALAAEGEFVGLADPEGSYVSEFGPLYPAQVGDISYGIGANGVTGFMHPPTPGAPNGEASDLPPALLSFSEPSGLFSGSLSVAISGQTPAHTVRYTTNGSEPSLANGATYTGPLSITSGTTLRARAFSGGVGGPLAQATYTPLGTTISYGIDPATFVSSLPLLVIDAASEPPTSRTPIPARFTLIDRQPATGTARLTYPAALATRGSIKLRGQTSAGLAKKPYGIEFWDAAGSPADLPVLGMAPESDWVLYASYQYDPDFLRNVLMFELYRRMGRWAPATRFVEVFFNTSASGSVHGGSYRGVYVLMENVKVGKNRVDITKMTASDNSGDALTGGYIIARDKWFDSAELMGGNSSYFPNWPFASGGAFVFKRPRYDLITAAQKAYITNYTMECDTAVARPDRRHPVTGLHVFDYLDTPSFIDHHMLNAFAKNVDGIRISTFLEKERLGKLGMSAVWDFDRTQDSDTDGRDDNPLAWNSDDASGSSTDFFSVEGRTAEGWFHHLHQIPAYLQAWVDRYDGVRATGVLDLALISAFLDERAAELTARDNNGTASADTPIARNFGRWSRTTRGVSTNGSNAESIIFGGASSSEINRHKTWLTQRISLMDSWTLKKPVASLAAGTVPAGAALNLTSPDLTGGAAIHYTLDGTDPWAVDGSISPGALTWSGPLPINQSAILVARLRNPSASNKHTAWSAPLRAVYFVEGQTELGVHQWDFEHPVDYLLPSHTYLNASLEITPGPTTTVERNTAAQDFDTAHLRLNNPLGATLRLALPTTGFQFASLSWLTRRSTQGAGTQIVEYTTDGVIWTHLETYTVENAAPQARSFDFTAIPAASDNPAFAVRVTFAQGIGGTGGNNRFDNITMTAVPLPGNNLPPHVQMAPANRALIEGGAGATVNLAAVFADPNNDPLVFDANSGHPGALGVGLSGNLLTLTPVGRGESTVTVTASDGHNPPVAATFRVLVHPAAHVLAADPYPFNSWPADSPAGEFPYNMVFLQGGENDSTLATALDRAYHIPPEDAAALVDADFPYAALSRTRINGLGADGISFINTGRGRDLGGALLALITTGLVAARLCFTAATLAPNSRSYAIRLQYRLGIEGPFVDLPGPDGQPVEYRSAAVAGHSATFGPVALPPAVLNQPYVQLLWRYYLTGGDSGARAQVRLDDILITADMDSTPAAFVFGPTPQGAQSGAILPPIAVTLVDGSGFRASGFSGPVQISLTGAGTLGGTSTVNANEGAAVFDDLVITGVGLAQLSVSAAGLDPVALPVTRTLALTELAVPRFIQGATNDTGINDQRLPFAWLARIEGLQPGATYRFANRVVLPGDAPASDGAGNMIFVTGHDSDWVRSAATPDFAPASLGSGHSSFTAAADGSHTAWYVTETTGNPRFTPGNHLHLRLLLNDGAGGTAPAFTLTTAQTTAAIRLGTGPDEASGVIGSSFTPGRRIAVLFDSADGSNRPLAATPVETTGAGASDLFAPFYQNPVAITAGGWGALLPNQLPLGLRRVEIRSATDGALIYPLVAADGFTGTVAGAPARSVNPANGLTPLILQTPAEPGRFDQWRARHFPAHADWADPAVSGPLADPSGAGVPNLLRHALGVGPFDPVVGLLPIVAPAGDGSLVVRFRYDPAKTDLTWRVRASSDLVD
ncbi:MAG: CotH kinase family protein, partial [Akkermansiaceae bacterium]|nr:CotH kinase family protein [Akkermansiaceae bacterium]